MEEAHTWRVETGWGSLDLLRARYVRHRFSRHAHQSFALGVIESGTLAFNYRGEKVLAPAGMINLAFPGEPHNGHGIDARGWAYRMFYLDPEIIREAAAQILDYRRELPFVGHGALNDPRLAGLIRSFHRDLETGQVGRLETESRLLRILKRLLTRYAEPGIEPRKFRPEPEAVGRAREILDHGRDLSLSDLGREVGLSPFHLSRVFTDRLGLSPHQYQIQTRLRRAKELLSAGTSLVETALEAGFSDQSHLNRRFKAQFGITLGQFRKIVQ